MRVNPIRRLDPEDAGPGREADISNSWRLCLCDNLATIRSCG
jgi:hypothetical protein